MRRILSLITAIVFFNACSSSTTSNPPKTQLEVREYQTRYFEIKDKNIIMKAVINTLMDEGYIIKEANTELGIITAEKTVDVSRTSDEVSSSKPSPLGLIIIGALVIITLGLIFLLSKDGKSSRDDSEKSPTETTYEKSKVIESTINVSEFSNGYKVRAVFRYKSFDNKGNPTRISQIDDMKFYQDFFSKLDKSVFLQKEYENR